jgi:ribosomal protein L11 methyltransferase
MCLEAIDRLPPGPAVDVGCGSGLLTQAWARLGRGHVLAVDADPAAVAQTRASVDLAGVGGIVETRLQAIETLRPRDLAGVTILANIPLAAHRALRLALRRPPRSAVVSGFRPSEAPEILAGYRDMGMRRIRSMRRGRFECHVFARMR